MELRRLGNSGLKVSALSLGAMTFGESHTFMKGVTSSDEDARRVFDRAIDAGINLVDTADIYGDGASEVLCGKWIKNRRDRVLLATKCRFPFGMGTDKKAGPLEQGLNRRHIVQACEDSLRRLGTDYVDLYQSHMQDGQVPIDETLRAFDDLVSAGKVRYVGCSNYTGYRLAEAAASAERRNTVGYVSVQLQWSLITRGAEREVIPACRRFGLGTMIWSPLARGFLSGKYRRGAAPPSGSRLDTWKDSMRSLDREQSWNILDAVVRVAEEIGRTPSAVALAWLLQKPETSTIVVGARTVAQLEDNLAAVDVKLSPAQMKSLDDVSAPEWGYPYDFIGLREPW